MKSEARNPANSAFAKLRAEKAALEKEVAELRAWKEREAMVVTAFAMAREANLPDNYTRLLLEVARNPRDGHTLEDAFKDIVEIMAEEKGG